MVKRNNISLEVLQAWNFQSARKILKKINKVYAIMQIVPASMSPEAFLNFTLVCISITLQLP